MENIDLVLETNNSFYPFLFLSLFFLVLVFILIYIAFKFIINTKPNLQKNAYKILKTLDLSDSKKASYKLTKYSSFFNNIYKEDMLSQIEQYKYSDISIPFDKTSLKLIKRFISSCKI